MWSKSQTVTLSIGEATGICSDGLHHCLQRRVSPMRWSTTTGIHLGHRHRHPHHPADETGSNGHHRRSHRPDDVKRPIVKRTGASKNFLPAPLLSGANNICLSLSVNLSITYCDFYSTFSKSFFEAANILLTIIKHGC